jgi:parvulin-like peptidyl-prolyl isomerase
MRNAFVPLVVALLAGLPVSAEILEQVLVKVNGEIITKTELEERQVATLRQRLRQNVTPADLSRDEELKKALDEITPQIVVDTIDELLIMQRGRELGYKMGDDQFNSILQNIRKENKLEDQAAFEAALKQEGLTLADLRKSLERQMIFARVQQVEVFGRIAVAEDEARRYYAEHPNEFSTPSNLTIREILIEVPTLPGAKPDAPGAKPQNQGLFSVALDDDAKAKAEAIRKRAVAGEDFAQLAGTESASASKANGGLIGPISQEELAPALAEVLLKMKPGEITEPLRTPRGYQILKLESKTESQTMTFEQARDQIANKVFAMKRQGELERYVRKLRSQAIIEWKNDEVRKLYERATGIRATAAAAQPKPSE